MLQHCSKSGTMNQYLHIVFILGLVFISAAFAAPSSGVDKLKLGKRHVRSKCADVSEVGQVSHRHSHGITANGHSNEFLLKKMNHLYDEIAQEVMQAELRHEEYKVEESNFHSNDIDKHLKSMLLSKMRQMYNRAMAQNNAVPYAKSWHVRDNTEIGKLIDHFLSEKISAIQSQRYEEPIFYNNNAAATRTQIHDHAYNGILDIWNQTLCSRIRMCCDVYIHSVGSDPS